MMNAYVIAVMKAKHRELDNLIKEETEHLSVPDEIIKKLKIKKLQLKTRIERASLTT